MFIELIDTILVEQELLAMVREVSQDKMYDTVEFNEFLTMIAKQKKSEVTLEDLIEAFRCFKFLIFKFNNMKTHLESLTRSKLVISRKMTFAG